MQNQTTIIRDETKVKGNPMPLMFNSESKGFEVAQALSPVFKSENSKEWPELDQPNIKVTNSQNASIDLDNAEFVEKSPTTFNTNPFA